MVFYVISDFWEIKIVMIFLCNFGFLGNKNRDGFLCHFGFLGNKNCDGFLCNFGF